MSARPIHADNSPVELLFTDPLRFATPGDRCEAPICVRLLELIQGAQSSIDFAVYGMRNQTQLLEALVAAQARGVVVRGVVDRNRDRENYYTSTDLWVSQLKDIRDDFDAETIPGPTKCLETSEALLSPTGGLQGTATMLGLRPGRSLARGGARWSGTVR